MLSRKLKAEILRVLSTAVEFSKGTPVAVFTVSFYLDHESRAISVCLDTRENSKTQVEKTNLYNSQHFHRHVSEGDIRAAQLWQANIGRNLSLGDFAYVNVGREPLVEAVDDVALCKAMVEALVDYEREVVAVAESPKELLLSCSTVGDEVGLVWTA